MRKIMGYGPPDASIMIVGDAPNYDDELIGYPFRPQTANGRLLRAMLRESGINPDNCYYTNVCKYVPPAGKIENWLTSKKKKGIENDWPHTDGYYYSEEVAEGLEELQQEIKDHAPQIIVGLGNIPLWACTGNSGIDDWRGSELIEQNGIPFVPTLHPASIIRNWATRPFAITDLKQRVARRLQNGFVVPQWRFNIAPTLQETLVLLNRLTGDVAVDIETSRGQIVCVGIAWSKDEAMCIPFIGENGAYWSSVDRNLVISALQYNLARPDLHIIGQNFNYDASYFKENFGYVPRVAFDTLIAQSVLFPGLPRGLGFLSSMYCSWHCYWKDDARDWNNLSDYAGLFTYNCRDVCSTWEIAQVQRGLLAKAGLTKASLTAQFQDRMAYGHYVFDMMFRGVIRDATKTAQLEAEISETCQQHACMVAEAAGHPLNLASYVQVSKLLYTEWGCRKPARRGKEAGGTGDEELKQVAAWHPERAAVLTAILEYRSLGSMRNNFLHAKPDSDGQLRSSFMPTGTETFRLTSSKNNFGRGTNLLNVSGSGMSHSGNKTPNFKQCIVPPAGFTFFDCDLARADLQVVAWEANDADLKQKFRENVDIHYENAKDVFGCAVPTSEQRERAKTFVHLTNYGGAARTCAIKVGCTVHEADMAQRRWFGAHPGIKIWHTRTQEMLTNGRTVTNAFGYRRIYFDRVDGLLPQALAWIPQSTIAILASKIHMAMEDACPMVQILLQCYDSVAGTYPTVYEDECLVAINKARQIVVPYDDPLIVPMGLKTSTISYGDCEKRSWPK